MEPLCNGVYESPGSNFLPFYAISYFHHAGFPRDIAINLMLRGLIFWLVRRWFGWLKKKNVFNLALKYQVVLAKVCICDGLVLKSLYSGNLLN